jgi:hypothetical protein
LMHYQQRITKSFYIFTSVDSKISKPKRRASTCYSTGLTGSPDRPD